MKNLKNKIFPFLIALSALSVSASAAFYSVSGLSKLFAGASLEVIIMASSLEIAKLVIASLLYQYWDSINKALRTYLTIAAGVLILITSMGIYGFLSAAYQETANKAGNIDAQISLVETKRDNIQNQLSVYNAEKESIDKGVTELRKGLSNNVITYTNAEGQLITTTSSATRKALEKQLDQAIERQTELNNKIDGLNTQLFDYESEIVEIKTGNDLAGELGPLKYLSGLTGVPMDKIINVLLLIIIFVFDPLAIALVIAANFAFAKLRTHEALNELTKIQEEEGLYNNEGSDIYTEDDLSDWDSTLNDGLEDLPWDKEEEETEDEDLIDNPSPVAGKPLMVDPETGKIFFVEDETPPKPMVYDEFDLDGDGKLSPIEQKLKEIDEQTRILEQVNSGPGDFYYVQRRIGEELSKLKKLRAELEELRNQNNTKDYF